MSDVEVLIRLIGTCVVCVIVMDYNTSSINSRQIREVIKKSIQVMVVIIILSITALIWVV